VKTYKEILSPKVLINSIIAGGLVFFGAFISGGVTLQGLCGAFCGAMVAFLTQIRVLINDNIKSKTLKGVFCFI